MSYSMWDDSAMDNWYKSVIQESVDGMDLDSTRTHLAKFCTHKKSDSGEYGGGIANEWFYRAMAADGDDHHVSMKPGGGVDHGHVKSTTDIAPTSQDIRSTTPDIRVSLNKPLPALPMPYYEYMFADAELEKQPVPKHYSPDNLSIDVDDGDQEMLTDTASTPGSLDPLTPPLNPTPIVTLDLSGMAQHSFQQACIHTTTKELTDNFLAAMGTGLAGDNLSINEADEFEKEEATIGFYGGFTVEESPSPFHAPIVDQESGFGDIRDGAEAFPQLHTFTEQRPKSYTMAEVDAMYLDITYDANVPQVKTALKPRSRTATESNGIKATTAMFVHRRQVKAAKTSARKPTGLGKSFLVKKKRNARDSFVTKSTFGSSAGSNNEIQYLSTKKLRISPEHEAPSSIPAPGPQSSLPSPTYSLITNLSHVYNDSPLEANRTSQITKPLTPGLHGFLGQFDALSVSKQSSKISKVSESQTRTRLTFGDRLHPNYLFTHTNFTPDCLFPATEFTYRNKPAKLTSIIEQASDLVDHAASSPIAALRSKSQENLRREAHLECTSARLEGYSVGQYRYYQGHLSIEEYKQCGMCICWDLCQCTKMCTRFGDMLCPCSNDVIIHKN